MSSKITSVQADSFGDAGVRFSPERSPLLSGHPISGSKGTTLFSDLKKSVSFKLTKVQKRIFQGAENYLRCLTLA